MVNNHHAQRWPGIAMALGAAMLFGVATPFSKLLLGTVDPQLLAGVLYLGAGIGLAVVRLGRDILDLPAAEAPLRRGDLPWLGLVILFGGVIGPLLLMFGLERVDATFGSLLLNLEGLATMSIAWVVFRENVDRRLMLGAFAILAGAAILSWGGRGFAVNAGAIYVVGACLAWGIDNNLTRKLSSADPVIIAMAKGLAAGAINIGIALASAAPVPAATTLLAAGILGFFAIGVSLVLFVLALRHLGTARTSAYFSLAPFIGAVVAAGVLDEPVTSRLLAAGVLMALGLWLHLAEHHEHEHTHDALEHEHAHRHDEHHQHGHDGPAGEPHSHWHRHRTLRHSHAHYPDPHHRHPHH